MINPNDYQGVNVTTLSKELAEEMIARYQRLGTPIEVARHGDSTTITVYSNRVWEPARRNRFGSKKRNR